MSTASGRKAVRKVHRPRDTRRSHRRARPLVRFMVIMAGWAASSILIAPAAAEGAANSVVALHISGGALRRRMPRSRLFACDLIDCPLLRRKGSIAPAGHFGVASRRSSRRSSYRCRSRSCSSAVRPRLIDVWFEAHNRLKSDIAPCPRKVPLADIAGSFRSW
jgi:hypothetical protein